MTVLPSVVVAAVQVPLPSSFTQVISPAVATGAAIARVETRHIMAMAPTRVFPMVRSIGFLLFIDKIR
jgi:hypothetical protein